MEMAARSRTGNEKEKLWPLLRATSEWHVLQSVSGAGTGKEMLRSYLMFIY